MNSSANSINEHAASEAFTRQSGSFDQLFSPNPIITYKRQRVREHVQQYLAQESKILEINAGTGEDAIWFARMGHTVHATDIAEGMQQVLAQKVKQHQFEEKITYELCSFTNLENLKQKGPYDLIFSNFAGLNCTGELDKVLESFAPLLKPGGIVTLVVLPGFCLWETLLVFKGKFKTAFRRFFGSGGVNAQIEGVNFTCWYYDPSYIINSLKKSFHVIGMEGLCTLVPPSYLENFPRKHEGLFKWLMQKENKYRSKWPWKFIGDYYIISLKKNAAK